RIGAPQCPQGFAQWSRRQQRAAPSVHQHEVEGARDGAVLKAVVEHDHLAAQLGGRRSARQAARRRQYRSGGAPRQPDRFIADQLPAHPAAPVPPPPPPGRPTARPPAPPPPPPPPSPPSPRDRIPLRGPRATRLRASHSVSGVLPVPPTARLPMLTTGIFACRVRRSPIR